VDGEDKLEIRRIAPYLSDRPQAIVDSLLALGMIVGLTSHHPKMCNKPFTKTIDLDRF
jgi:hypothetical protein